MIARRLVTHSSGQSIVEFALVSVIYFITLFGTLEFGLAVFRYNMASDLAQEGARWASVHGSTSASPASAADVQTFVNTRALGITVTVTTTPAPSTVAPGSFVTVQVSTSYTPLTHFVPTSTLSLSSTAKMLVSR